MAKSGLMTLLFCDGVHLTYGYHGGIQTLFVTDLKDCESDTLINIFTKFLTMLLISIAEKLGTKQKNEISI